MTELRQRTTSPVEIPSYKSTEDSVEVETTLIKESVDGATVLKRKRLYFHHELNEWQKDNHFIRSGYVFETNSYKTCFQSLFYIHNETGNIYSHLIPAGLVMVSIVLYINKVLVEVPGWAQLNFIIFGLAVNFCLLMSSFFHCTKTHSYKVAEFNNRLDYFGIIVLITCSIISVLRFAFVNDTFLRTIFISLTLFFGSVCTVLSLDAKFSSGPYRPFRSTMFVLFGLSGALPIIVSIFKFGLEDTRERSSVEWLLLEGFFYILGAVLYAMRIPERLVYVDDGSPGIFDIYFQSHQIFHVLVLVAAYCHWKCLVNCYLYMIDNLI